MKIYQQNIKLLHGSAYIEYELTDKEQQWIGAGKDDLLNLKIINIYTKVYPDNRIQRVSPLFLVGQSLNTIFVNISDNCFSELIYSDKLLRELLLQFAKEKIVPIADANKILLSTSELLNIPFKPLAPFESFQPKSLKQQTINYILQNKKYFFKNFKKIQTYLPLTDLPELNIEYKKAFIGAVEEILTKYKSGANTVELIYLDKLFEALKMNNPYNNLHYVLQDIDQSPKTVFWSDFKKNIRPLRNEVVQLMKEYYKNKPELNKCKVIGS